MMEKQLFEYLESKKSIIDLLDEFKTDSDCESYIFWTIIESGKICPYCASDHVICLLGKTKRMKCFKCRRQFGIKVGTVFHNGKLPLRKYFTAIFIILKNPNTSSYQLSRVINVHQENANNLIHLIKNYDERRKNKKV